MNFRGRPPMKVLCLVMLILAGILQLAQPRALASPSFLYASESPASEQLRLKWENPAESWSHFVGYAKRGTKEFIRVNPRKSASHQKRSEVAPVSTQQANALAQLIPTHTPTEFGIEPPTRTPTFVPVPWETLTLIYPTRPTPVPFTPTPTEVTVIEGENRDWGRVSLIALVVLLWFLLGGWVYLLVKRGLG